MYILTTTNTKKPYHLDLADLVCLGSGKGKYRHSLIYAVNVGTHKKTAEAKTA